ncbi:hypothetical protein PHYPO_G00232750 [Pangasianodon hypophthalmus]|uniref:Uncharacterized protein n=1 Tax=Pangasianodon hypophthalmus TaxID=310915 RepID=A0A5N5NJW8_PANHP|nr:hypothetical protein PHYPO_G00232750 [Pangasianodon hypophthalmus]
MWENAKGVEFGFSTLPALQCGSQSSHRKCALSHSSALCSSPTSHQPAWNCRAHRGSSLLQSSPSARGDTALKPSLQSEAAGGSQLPRAHGGRRDGQAGAHGLRVRVRPNHRQHPRHQSGNQCLLQVREAITLLLHLPQEEFITDLRKSFTATSPVLNSHLISNYL